MSCRLLKGIVTFFVISNCNIALGNTYPLQCPGIFSETPENSFSLVEKLKEFDQIIGFIKENWSNRKIHENLDGFLLEQKAVEFRNKLLESIHSEEAYYRELEKFTTQLHDGHLYFIFDSKIRNSPSMKIDWSTSGLTIQKVKEGYAIIRCDAPCSGIKVPALISSIDETPIHHWVEERAELMAGSTPHARSYQALSEFLNLSTPQYLGKAEKISYLNEGKVIEYKLKWTEKAQDSECMKIKVEDDTLIIKFKSFTCPGNDKRDAVGFEKMIVDALSKLNPKSLILDLRDNPGGWDDYIQLLYSLFIKETSPWQGLSYMKNGIFSEEFHSNISPYNNPLLEYLKNVEIKVLTNSGCGSSCDVLAAILKDSKRARIYGEKTQGYCGDGTYFEVPGKYKLRVPNAICYRTSGESFEGKGIEPDFQYTPDLDGFINERDPLLAFAMSQK